MGCAAKRLSGRMVSAMLATFAVALLSMLTATSATAAPLSVAVSANHLVDGNGARVRLLGVNHASFEYACQQGWGYDDGEMDDADAAAIASWHATAVRIPLNEDCWLGINGMPNASQGHSLTVAGYRAAVQSYVNALNAHGLYAILDLHWTAPGSRVADGLRAMPDDHSAAFWTSVATTFKSNPAVVFDAFNEPFSPAETNDPGHPVSWYCWRDGGCQLPSSRDADAPDNAHLYTAVGMQALVTAIRDTGAQQPIMLGGLDYSNDLTGWLAHKPNDPAGQLVASFHNYQGKACATSACWTTTLAAVAAQVPLVSDELGEDNYLNASCGDHTPSTYAEDFMTWADGQGVGYLMWGWWYLSPSEIQNAGCHAFYLVTEMTNHTPAAPNGTALHDRLAKLAAAGKLGGGDLPRDAGGSGSGGGGSSPTPTPTVAPTATPGAGAQTAAQPQPTGSSGVATKPSAPTVTIGAKVASGASSIAVSLRATADASGKVDATTTKTFETGGKHRRVVGFGSSTFSLSAAKTTVVTLRLSKTARALLAEKRSIAVRFAVSLATSGGATGTTAPVVTLKLPAKKHSGKH